MPKKGSSRRGGRPSSAAKKAKAAKKQPSSPVSHAAAEATPAPASGERAPRAAKGRPAPRRPSRGRSRSRAGDLVTGDAVARQDWLVAAALVAATFVLFAATTNDVASGGDATESIAGVESIGVLHPPGYPAYVIAARLFTWLLPVDIVLGVNLFSAVCSALAVGALYLAARDLGASIVGAAIGGLVLASGTSFWFYAGFAKHYALSTALVAFVGAAALRWHRTQRPAWMIAAGGLLGVLAGASWQLGMLTALPVGVLILAERGRRHWDPRTLVIAAAAGACAALALYGFVFVRAGSDPALNWGRATTTDRLVSLVRMHDFGFGVGSSGSGDGTNQSVSGDDLSALPKRLGAHAVLATREHSLLAVLLAGLGVVALWGSRPNRSARAFLVTALAGNIVIAAIVAGPSRSIGFETITERGGYLAGEFVALGLATAVGASALLELAARRWGDTPLSRRIAGAALGLVLVAPAVVVHAPHAVERREPDYAAAYGRNVLSGVDEGALLIVRGVEQSFPIQFEQVVEDERPDVDVVLGNALGLRWYREQVEDRLDVDLRDDIANERDAVTALLDEIDPERPVFFDIVALDRYSEVVPIELEGIVGRRVEGAPAPDPEVIEAAIASYDLDGVYDGRFRDVFPFDNMLERYALLHARLGALYLGDDDLDEARTQFDLALQVDADNETAREGLRQVEARGS